MCDRCKRMKRENRERRNALAAMMCPHGHREAKTCGPCRTAVHRRLFATAPPPTHRAAPETQRHRQDSISLAPSRPRSGEKRQTVRDLAPRLPAYLEPDPDDPAALQKAWQDTVRSLCSPEVGTDVMRRAGALEAARVERAVAQRAAIESQQPTPQAADGPSIPKK